MIAKFVPSRLQGSIEAPPSKSMAHRFLIGAALSKKTCQITGIEPCEDVLATMDCLSALGVKMTLEKGIVVMHAEDFMKENEAVLPCRESGSTLRFFLPLALCLGKPITLIGSERLLERPLDVYESLCRDRGFYFKKDKDSVTVCGSLQGGEYTVRGDISSQFITGLILALVYLGTDSRIRIIPPFESRSYVNLTLAMLHTLGAKVQFVDEWIIEIKGAELSAFSGKIEGDYSNAAFLDAFNETGSKIEIHNLNPDSLQGDRVYAEYFSKLSCGTPTLDISDCPDLGPILLALAALKKGATFTGTDRLKTKESDRGAAMQEELRKLGGEVLLLNHQIVVKKQDLSYQGIPLDGHNDHRIVMALSVLLNQIGGELSGIEAVRKSYPEFFSEIKRLGAKIKIS